MITKNETERSGTPNPPESRKRTGSEGEPADAQRTAADDLRHRALERWENEGGSGPECDNAAAQSETRE